MAMVGHRPRPLLLPPGMDMLAWGVAQAPPRWPRQGWVEDGQGVRETWVLGSTMG